MIIVNPYGVTSLVLTHDSICNSSVDGNVMLPAIRLPYFVFRIVRNLIMKSWPNDLLAISIVMALKIRIRYKYRNGPIVLGKIVCDFRFLRRA
jgi:hypothetical protein